MWRLLQLLFESVISSFDGPIGRWVTGYGTSAMCPERVAIVVLLGQGKVTVLVLTWGQSSHSIAIFLTRWLCTGPGPSENVARYGVVGPEWPSTLHVVRPIAWNIHV